MGEWKQAAEWSWVFLSSMWAVVAWAGHDDPVTVHQQVVVRSPLVVVSPEPAPEFKPIVVDPEVSRFYELMAQLATREKMYSADLLVKAFQPLKEEARVSQLQLNEFLEHHYFFSGNRLGIALRSEVPLLLKEMKEQFIFDESATFVLVDREVRRGSFKEIKRVMRANDPRKKQYALARLLSVNADDSTLTQVEKDRQEENYEEALHEVSIYAAIQEALGSRPLQGLLSPSFIDLSPHTNRLLILTPFYRLGNAHQIDIQRSLEEEHDRAIAGDLLTGIKTLHRLSIVHRDIKPLNVFLRQDHGRLEAVLADFGGSYQEGQSNLQEMRDKNEIKTTYRYLAPEAVEKHYLYPLRKKSEIEIDDAWRVIKQKYKLSSDLPRRWKMDWPDLKTDQASDMWSLGVTLLEISSAKTKSRTSWSWVGRSRDHQEHPSDYLNVDQSVVDYYLGELQDHPLYPVIYCLLRVEIEKRCTAEQAYEIFEEQSDPEERWNQILAAKY